MCRESTSQIDANTFEATERARLKESWLKVLAICLKSPKGLATPTCADKRNGSCCPAEGVKVVDGGRRRGRAFLTLCRCTRATTTTASATMLQLQLPCASTSAPGTISTVICGVFSLLAFCCCCCVYCLFNCHARDFCTHVAVFSAPRPVQIEFACLEGEDQMQARTSSKTSRSPSRSWCWRRS